MGRTWYLQGLMQITRQPMRHRTAEGDLTYEKRHPVRGVSLTSNVTLGSLKSEPRGRVRSSMSFRGKRELLVQLAPPMTVLGSGAATAICAQPMVPFLPELIPILERHGYLDVSRMRSAHNCWPSVQRRWTGCCPAASASRVEHDQALATAQEADAGAHVLPSGAASSRGSSSMS